MILLSAGWLATAAPARADEGLFLTWNDCALAPAATHDLLFGCETNFGQQLLFCAFRLPAPADSVLGVEIVVDVQHSDPGLPSWWRFDPGGCRAGDLSVDFDFTAKSACADFLLGQAAGNLIGYFVTQPHGGANQARILAAAAVLPDAGYRQLDASSLYYAARIVINDFGTVGPGTVCTGCDAAACLVLNTVIVRRQPGALSGDVYLSVPGPDNANFATWRGGAGADCQAVPARAMTWGQIKELYR
jgi:hypothetical protein